MKIWMFPIEPLEERYSADWYTWWVEELSRLRMHWAMVDGGKLTEKIEQGEFLDVLGTNYWKATQLSNFIGALHSGDVKDGDWVVLHDGWNPAVEQLAYMRDLGKVKFKIAGLFHAGTWDPHDFITKPTRMWAQRAERSWAHIYDRMFFATEFHKKLFMDYVCNGDWERNRVGPQLRVTGFPLFVDGLKKHREPWVSRERIVVFAHRLAAEKQPWQFEHMKYLYQQRYGNDGTRWTRTKEVCASKSSYYALLGKSRVAVSCALQETWGIAMLESLALGCHPVVPDALSYKETLQHFPRYPADDLERAVDLIHEGLNAAEAAPYATRMWDQSIENIVKELT